MTPLSEDKLKNFKRLSAQALNAERLAVKVVTAEDLFALATELLDKREELSQARSTAAARGLQILDLQDQLNELKKAGK